jgi:CMP-N,N'-diacetyllegionaminic acid synthase
MTSTSEKVLAIIPARGGSKGLPRKNILPLGGEPLVTYTIEAAKGCSSIDRVILSTDSLEIANIGKQLGVEVPFIRPSELATDTAHPYQVLQHAVEYLKNTEDYIPDIIITLQPTSPLRTSNHIEALINVLQSNRELDSAISICETPFSPYWMFTINHEVLRPFVDDKKDYSLTRRQDLNKVYKPNGAVYATRYELLIEQNIIFSAFASGKTGYIIMDPISSLDIDTQIDFNIVESILRDNQ